MKLAIALLALLLLPYTASAAFDETIWGSEDEGWEGLSAFELSATSVVVELTDLALHLNNNESAPVLREIANMGPRPAKTGDKQKDLDGYFAWNTRLEKDVLKTKLGNSWRGGTSTAEDWIMAFLAMRRLRLYEASGYKVIGMNSVAYSDVGWRHQFLMVKE